MIPGGQLVGKPDTLTTRSWRQSGVGNEFFRSDHRPPSDDYRWLTASVLQLDSDQGTRRRPLGGRYAATAHGSPIHNVGVIPQHLPVAVTGLR